MANLQAILTWSLAQQGDETRPSELTRMDPEVQLPVCNLDLAGKRFGKNNQSNLLSVLHFAARPGQAYETTKRAHTHDI